MKFIVTWQSNYNGVSLDSPDIDWTHDDQQLLTAFEQVADEVMMTLPSFTYQVASRWDELQPTHIEQLKQQALVIINKQFPTATIGDVCFEQDNIST